MFLLIYFVMCGKSFEACALKKILICIEKIYKFHVRHYFTCVCVRAQAHILDETLLVTSTLLQKME